MAAMRSSSYVIYETVMHSFDGPVISGVSCSAGEDSLTVIWNTDVISDSFVVYSTDSGLATTYEQGSSIKNATAHSVTVTGLNNSTTYYYRVRSERINGGITTDSTIRNCTTLASSAPPPSTPTGGGGILIIDKTDKMPPVISDVNVTDITDNSARISWTTDEDATSFIEYGLFTTYGSVYGEWSSSTEHTVILEDLDPESVYHFRALSSDDWGNLGRSEDFTFTTLEAPPEEEEGEEIPPELEEIEEIIEEEEGTPESILAAASEKVIEILNKFSSQVSVNVLETTLSTQVDAIRRLADIIPPPLLSGEPRVEIGTDEITVFWTSDKEANSMVAIASETDYDPDRAEPYTQVVGHVDELVTEHEVRIIGLEPDTPYHYQLRSTPAVGPAGISRDFTFRTKLEALEITSFFMQVIDTQTAVFKWVTNKDADSAVTFIPYRGNILAVEEAKTIKDNTAAVIHEIRIKEFVEGTIYQVELSSQDTEGNIATEQIPSFSTSEDDKPPVISHIQTDSTVFVDQGNRIQTIISWLTNEPCTSRVYYQEGVVSADAELTGKTNLNTNYTKEHVVVVTKFDPGLVYSFRVESIDSGGNISLSKLHTFMTPKQKESIFQIIIRILEETFSWTKKLF